MYLVPLLKDVGIHYFILFFYFKNFYLEYWSNCKCGARNENSPISESALDESSEIRSRKAVDVFRRVDRVADDVFAEVNRKRKLNHDAVNFRIEIEFRNYFDLKRKKYKKVSGLKKSNCFFCLTKHFIKKKKEENVESKKKKKEMLYLFGHHRILSMIDDLWMFYN